ncbi:MAG: ABC transporter substrate-binding protein [Chitinophagales bacterium]
MATSVSKRLLIVMLAVLSVYSCGKKKGKNEVNIHELSDTDQLNPTNYQSADAGYYLAQMFMSPWSTDPKTLKQVPIMAIAMPEESYDEATDLLTYTYELRPECKWDNGEAITAHDMEFSYKLFKCPTLNNEQSRPYFEKLVDVKLYPDNPRKISVVWKGKYILSREFTGYFCIPQYVYDPKKVLDGYTIKELTEKQKELAQDQKLKDFGNEYNSEKYQREKGYIVGCGPYEFSEWVTGQRIVLTKKKNWWGDQFAAKEESFQAFPQKLIYTIIKDQTAALTALKGKKLDVMYGIKPKDFVEQCQKNEKITGNYNLFTPPTFAYTFFAFNMRNPKLEDVRVRRALCYLTDTKKIIDVIGYGLGDRVTGPISRHQKGAYNDTIKPYDYDIEKAKALLAEAGWADHNGNGILDKKINGEDVELSLTFTYNAGNDQRRDAGLIFKESCRQASINIDVVPQDWPIYLENNKKHNFEVNYGAWIGSSSPNDPKQIWHTESINGGSNYYYFGNAESDKVIEELRVELNEDKRNHLYRRFQELVHDQCPGSFIWSPLEKIAISKRFKKPFTGIVRPGFNESTFELQD